MRIKTKAALVTLVLVAACAKEGVTTRHIAKALEVCDANDGLKAIHGASSKAEFANCGYRCAAPTGRQELEMQVDCQNTASFTLKWVQ